ncbi:Wzy polymerase domain-containing protein [Undibacterium sp. TJN25]|uniref:PglL family O-oligosaccharyltransferase n=1 Tax=Undibacterium sp. TJN25 TaxID=3413056 RepID=UPI003BF11ED1
MSALAVLAFREKSQLNLPGIMGVPVAIALLISAQLLFGLIEHRWEVFIAMAYLALAALAMVYGATVAAEPGGDFKICLMLAAALLLAGLLSVVMQNAQFLGLDLSPVVMYIAHSANIALRPYANVAQPNQLALLLCMALAAVWWLYQQSRLPAAVAALLAVFLLWGLSLTQSRIGWIICPAFVVMLWPRRRQEKPVSGILLIALMLAYIGFVLAMPALSAMVGVDTKSVAEHIGGRSERTVLMQQALQMSLQHPWFGVGWFGFGSEQVRIAADFTPTTYAEHSHNLILNFAAELGWPATIALIAVLAAWYFSMARQAGRSDSFRFASLVFVAALVHSMVEFPLWYAFVLIPVAVLMGMVHQMHWQTEPVPVARKSMLAVAVLPMIVMAVMTLDYQRVQDGFAALRWEQAGYTYDKKALEQPEFTLYPYFFDYFKLMKVQPREGMSEQEIAFVERTGYRFGFVHILNTMAEVYVLNGQPQKALRTMITLQRLHPFSYNAYYDYWKAKGAVDPARYGWVFSQMPPRERN